MSNKLTCQVFSQREPFPGGHGRELRARQRFQVAAALGLLVDHADAEPPETEGRYSNLATLSLHFTVLLASCLMGWPMLPRKERKMRTGKEQTNAVMIQFRFLKQ